MNSVLIDSLDVQIGKIADSISFKNYVIFNLSVIRETECTLDTLIDDLGSFNDDCDYYGIVLKEYNWLGGKRHLFTKEYPENW